MRLFAKRLWRALIAAAACAPAGGAGGAEEPPRPTAALRTVRAFDFEERPMNPEPVPMHWFRAQHDPPHRIRPGFPAWNRAEFDDRVRTSGEWSVRLPTQGGSVSLRLSSGVIAAIPGADYEVACMVRTEALHRAKARLSARFLDDRRAVISGTERSSEPIETGGEWRRVAFEMRGNAPAAAWVQIDLELLQPRRLIRSHEGAAPSAPENEDTLDEPLDPLDQQRVTLEDVRGGAWFDDLVISQVPRVEIAVSGDGNVALGPAAPEFIASVRDLTGERLWGEVTLTGMDGEPIAAVRFEAPAGQEQFVWKPALTEYGWGRLRLDVSNETGVIASTSTTYAWLPPLPTRRDRAARGGERTGAFPEAERFLLIAEDDPPGRLGFTPAYARATGSGAVQLPAWTEGLTRSGVAPTVKALHDLVEKFATQGVSMTLSLSRVPGELGKVLKIDTTASPFAALSPEKKVAPAGSPDAKNAGAPVSPSPATTAPPAHAGAEAPDAAWKAYLAEILSKFGQRVRRWQVGRTGEPLPFWRATLETDLQEAEASFSKLVPKPTIVAPWAPEQALDGRLSPDRGVVVVLPWESPAETLRGEVERIQGGDRKASDSAFVIGVPPEDRYGARSVAVELAKRAVLAWAGEPRRLAVESPWDVTERGAGPTIALPVWRQVVERLGGRRIAGELPIASGATCLILDGPQGGALVGWSDWASPEDATVEMFLGNGVVSVVDVFGNAEPAPMAGGLHRVSLGELPVFVEGINVELARFRAAFEVDPGTLPAEAALHSAELLLHNPWPVAISGTLRVLEPTKWKIEPRVLGFDVPAGESQRLPVDVSFGVGEESGRKRIVAEADVNADARYPRVRLSAPLNIGAGEIQLTPSYAFVSGASGGGEQDVALTISVTNNGDEPSSMRVFALAPGYPRQEATISALGPGQSAVRRFSFAGGVKKLIGVRVRVGAVQVGGAERINKGLLIQ